MRGEFVKFCDLIITGTEYRLGKDKKENDKNIK